MDRREFLKYTTMGTGAFFSLSSFMNDMGSANEQDTIMPALFLGHGNPMNAIEKNEFHNSWAELGKKLPQPKAILCVSAHWQTQGTKVTAMEHPQTIHDFGGFPDELFAQQYPAPGSPLFAEETKKLVTKTTIQHDNEWGLDHGTWSVLLPMYPKADIPVFQLSLDHTKPPQYHYDLAKELAALRKKGVLIIGSGNIVHNLRMVNFHAKPYDWTIEFDAAIKQFIKKGDHQSVIDFTKMGEVARLAVPTNEHFLPLLYTLALQEKNEGISFFNEKADLASVTMTSLKIG